MIPFSKFKYFKVSYYFFVVINKGINDFEKTQI